MQEHELNTIMDVVSDPVKNVYDLSNRKNVQEIERIIRIFNINAEQKFIHRLFALKNLSTLKLVMSNN